MEFKFKKDRDIQSKKEESKDILNKIEALPTIFCEN